MVFYFSATIAILKHCLKLLYYIGGLSALGLYGEHDSDWLLFLRQSHIRSVSIRLRRDTRVLHLITTIYSYLNYFKRNSLWEIFPCTCEQKFLFSTVCMHKLERVFAMMVRGFYRVK